MNITLKKEIFGAIVAGVFAVGFVFAYAMFNTTQSYNMPNDMTQNSNYMMQGNMMSMMNTNMMNDMMGEDMMNQMMEPNAIHMGMNMFMPDTVRVNAGSTITWQNHSPMLHNVVGVYKTESGKGIVITSPDLEHMQSWSYTFDEKGVFRYHCTYHYDEGMTGEIVIS